MSLRERPCGNANFLVDLGLGDPREPAAGFAEVIFPAFVVADADAAPDPAPTAGEPVLLAVARD